MMVILLSGVAAAVEPYPVTDADLLALRNLETEALYLALKKHGRARARYARTAVIAHGRRMDRLGPELAAAERAVERAGAGTGVPLLRAYPADQARERALAAGSAMAVLLDDLDPGWRSKPEEPLDALLDAATSGLPPLLLSEDPRAAAEETAALRQAQIVEGTGYLTQPGYGLVVKAPLAVVDDDPFRAIALEDRARYYRGDVAFSGPPGTVRIEGHGAFVDPGEIRVAGLDKDTVHLSHEGERVVVTGAGVDIRLAGAVYGATKNSMTLTTIPGVTMEPDPAVFALSLLGRTAGWHGAPSTQVRHLRERIGEGCASVVRRFGSAQGSSAKAERADPSASYALALELGGPPGFAPPAGAPPELAPLAALLRDFWSCAGLEAVWNDEERAAWIHLGQEALEHAAPALALAREVDPASWRPVRLVPDAYRPEVDAVGFPTPHGGVTVVVGPPRVKEGPDPAAIAREALHQLVDPRVLGRPCPAVTAAFQASARYPAVAASAAAPDRWLAASLARALVVDAGVLRGEDAVRAVEAWVAEGWLIVPTILDGLQGASWEVWLDAQCGGTEPEPRLPDEDPAPPP